MKFLLEYCKRPLLYGLLICFSIIDLSGSELGEPMPVDVSSTEANDLKRLYDLVLQNLDTSAEWMYLDSLENEATREGDRKYQGLAYRNKVRYHYNKINFDSAVYYANLAIPFFRKNKQRENLTEVESMIINLHTWRYEYEFALIKGNEMYDESERTGDTKGMIAACENIGFALVCSFHEEEALDWYRKCLALLGNEKGQELRMMQMEILTVDCFLTLGEIDSMNVHLDTLHGLLTDFELGRDKHHDGKVKVAEYWVWLYAQKAEAALKKGSVEEAKGYLDEASHYVSQGVEAMSMEVYYWASSDYYQAIGDYAKALEAEENSSSYSLTYKGKTAGQLYRFAAIYEKLGNLREASALYKAGLAVSDSTDNDLFSTQVSQFNSIYEVKELTEEGKLSRLEIGQLSLILASLFAFSCLLGVFVFIFSRYKKHVSEATRKAKEEDLKTTIFLDNVSREIRLSLEEIAGLSRGLIGASDVKDKKMYSGRIRSKNGTLQRVIFNILDVSKIESDQMVFDHVKIYLPDMMNGVKGWAARFMASDRCFKLLSMPELYLMSDLSRLRQVLENLLYYFITHASQGDILMEYHLKEGAIEFNMSCAGLYLGDEERKLLFDRQVQAGKNLEDMGLELVICKELIVKMGGALSVSETKQEGTGFTFTLPIETN